MQVLHQSQLQNVQKYKQLEQLRAQLEQEKAKAAPSATCKRKHKHDEETPDDLYILKMAKHFSIMNELWLMSATIFEVQVNDAYDPATRYDSPENTEQGVLHELRDSLGEDLHPQMKGNHVPYMVCFSVHNTNLRLVLSTV